MVKFKDLMEECKNRGLNYCRMTIYRIGIAKGFLIHDGNKCIIDKDKFDKYAMVLMIVFMATLIISFATKYY